MEKPWDWDDHALRFLPDHDLCPAGNEAPFDLSRSTTRAGNIHLSPTNAVRSGGWATPNIGAGN
jgi:hypothetical protein